MLSCLCTSVRANDNDGSTEKRQHDCRPLARTCSVRHNTHPTAAVG